METLNDIVAQLITLGPELLVVLVVWVAGYILRLIKIFPNKWIPVCLIIVGTALYPLTTNPGQMSFEVRNPLVRQCLIGLVLGFTAWLVHGKLLKPLEAKIPWLKGILTTGDTETVESNGPDKG